MSRAEKWARKKLKFVSAYKNSLYNKNHPHVMYGLNNVASNMFGDPLIQLTQSDKLPHQVYWKRNPDGKWARIGNQFLFIDQEHMDLLETYKSYEFIKLY